MLVFLTTASAAPPMASSPRTVSVDDPPPVRHTASGTVPVVFTVSLNGPALLAGERVTVHLAAADYCATGVPYRANAYYQPVETNLTFVANGPRAQFVTVLVYAGPGTGRGRDSFGAQVSDAVGAAISKAVGVGTLIERDAIMDDPFFFDACLSRVRWASLPPG
jgi:hypothetical protein